ncbi:MAG: hypothetical protein MUC36_04325 [Planctomycetes bacterium]|jgi:hypothetical protein|nr:hypothetical protein [Planctomycetota bacterium]
MNAVVTQQSRLNAGTKALHDALIARHKALSDRLSVTASLDDADAIVREMQEVNFRVMMSGSLLFKQTTAAIDTQLQSVMDASTDLDEAIAEADKIRDVIKAISKFLGLVDKVLDRIKLL